MAKRSGLGASRAARKTARLRQQRARARGLPIQAEPAARAGEVRMPRAAQAARSAPARSRVPQAVKWLAFLVLLLAAVWWAADVRKGFLD